MRRKVIEVKRGNVLVKVYERQRVKSGSRYTEFIVADQSADRRKLWTFADLAKAKEKAVEVAEAVQSGNAESARWESGLRLEIRKALEAIEPTGMSVLPACQLFAQAVQVLGTPQEIIVACHYWKQHRPDKPFSPTPTEKVVELFKASRKGRISARRYRTEESYLGKVTTRFTGRMIHDISTQDIDLLLGEQKWKPKTRADFIGCVSGVFKFAQSRSFVPRDQNPLRGIARGRQTQSRIEIFEPWELRQMLNRLSVAAPELVPFLAIWAFGGIRKDEIARLTWPEVNRGLVTGYIELQAPDTKTGEYRTVPILPNLKAWLLASRKESGHVLPAFWLENTKSGSPRIDEITRFISRNTGVPWKDNGPRHSFGTYYFKLCKDPGETVRTMGTSLQKFQKNYWNKARTITDESAKEWFSIVPDTIDNIVPIPAKGDSSGPVNVAAG